MRLEPLAKQSERLVIGLMSGTSADGIDASLVRISGTGNSIKVKELGFYFQPYDSLTRQNLLRYAKGDAGGSHDLTLMAFLLGDLFTEASLSLCKQCGVSPEAIDLIGSHGHTVYHIPRSEEYEGRQIRGTMQIGDVSRLAETFSCPVVSDFRVRDFAVGGQGAPLVPYTEYLLYRSETQSVALQNIGGIGNITILAKGCRPEDVIAFDTGPGNMVIDAVVSHYSHGAMRYDDGGAFAATGKADPGLMAFLSDDAYLALPYPKTTGREFYGETFVSGILSYAEEHHLKPSDVVCTATWFTAESIRRSLSLPGLVKPDVLVIGGGGSHNLTLLKFLSALLPTIAVKTEEEIGYNSDSKEAVAFAMLANECICGSPNSLPGATGGSRPVVLGKIQL